MQNPYRVTPPLMSEDTSIQDSENMQERQPSFSSHSRSPSVSASGAEVETPKTQVEQPRPTIESFVEMEPVKKTEQQADNAVKASSSAQTSGNRQKTKKAPNAFRTISEVAKELDVQQHVLRFWETKFTQVKPLKRGGGRRYYRPEDVAILKRIHHLLYTEGYTIKGVQKLLKGRGKAQIVAGQANNENATRDAAPAPQPKVQPSAAAQASQTQTQPQAGMSAKQRAVLEMMLAELKSLRSMVKA